MRILINGGGGIGMLFCFYLIRILKHPTVVVCQTNSQKAEVLHSRFPETRVSGDIYGEYDIIIECSNTIEGLAYSLNRAERGGKICIMSHLYGCETSFVYEQLCKKELSCTFPLRNGERANLALAERYIHDYWTREDDILFSIHNNIREAFENKSSTHSCKQIVHSAALFL